MVRIIDLQNPEVRSTWEPVFSEQPVDLVGITAMTPQIKQANEIAERIKKRHPEIPIIVGGAHSTLLPQQTLLEFPSFDLIVIGEGEETLCALAQRIEERRQVPDLPNLIRRGEDARRVARKLGTFAENGWPARDLLDNVYPVKGYSITVKPEGGTLPRVSISDARRKVVFAPLGDSVRVAGFVEIGDRDTTIPPARIGALLDATREVLGYGVIDGDLHPWAGLRPATPSGRPIIGRTPIRNLHLNTGHGALGWTLAGGSARLIADEIAGRTPTIDDRPFAYKV